MFEKWTSVSIFILLINIIFGQANEAVNCNDNSSNIDYRFRELNGRLDRVQTYLKDITREVNFIDIRTSYSQTDLDDVKTVLNVHTDAIKSWGDGMQYLSSSQGALNTCVAHLGRNKSEMLSSLSKDIKSIYTAQQILILTNQELQKTIVENNVKADVKAVASSQTSIATEISKIKSNVIDNKNIFESQMKDLKSDINKAISGINTLNSEISILKNYCNSTCHVKDNSKNPAYPRTCAELKRNGNNKSGIYKIQPKNKDFFVYCDMETSGGGWTVFQRRFDGSQDFYRNWEDYKIGFGNFIGEYWLGLEHIHELTDLELNEIYIQLENFNGTKRFARYSAFYISSEKNGYALNMLGTYSGDAGDSLRVHAGMSFSTMDKDHDKHVKHCSQEYSGAWWYYKCHESNLNGSYLKGKIKTFANGMCWLTFEGFYYSLKSSQMMIRPAS